MLECKIHNLIYKYAPETNSIEEIRLAEYPSSTVKKPADNEKLVLVVPAVINGCKITKIDYGTFDYFKHRILINKILIPCGVTTIADFTFSELNVDKVYWPDGCDTISRSCFAKSDIRKIQNIEHITTIHDNAFTGCESLETFIWPEKCKTIPTECFEFCVNLRKIDVYNVEKVCSRAFAGCSKLKNLKFGPSLETLEKNSLDAIYSDCCRLDFSSTAFPFLNYSINELSDCFGRSDPCFIKFPYFFYS